MINKFKNTIFLILLGITISPIVFAASYPEMGGITISSETTAAQYVVYFFNLAIAIGAFLAVIMLIMASFDYMMSRGDAGKLETAKDRIKNIFLGIIVLFGSYIILNIINSELVNVNIKTLPTQEPEEATVSNDNGVYLYDGENFVSQSDPLILKETKTGFVKDDNFTTRSIKFLNPSDYKFGGVLFDDSNLRGNCSYLLSDLSNIDNVSGNENKPAIGKLLSMIVFKTKPQQVSVKLYNSINCQEKTDDYCRVGDSEAPCQTKDNKVCTINSGDGFENISSICPNFDTSVGVLSIEVSSNVGILLKSSDKNAKGRCQFFEPSNACINTVKYSYVYRNDYSRVDNKLSNNINLPGVVLPIKEASTSNVAKFIPVSFMLFPLYAGQ